MPVPAPPPVTGEEVVKDDDRVLVRLAIAQSAHIVTTDTPLRDALTASDIMKSKGLLVLSVEQALEHIMQEDP